MRSQTLRQKLHRAWLTQLQLEYDEISFKYGVKLRPPVFEVSGSRKQLGSWRRDTRCIAISEQLIETFPWHLVLQVLKHEMAHQYCDEVADAGFQGHGSDFQDACNILGVLPEFRTPSVITGELLKSLDDGFCAESKTAKVLAKVEKLLALGNSPQIHEAELALQKAHQLIEKYQLESFEQSQSSDFQVLVIETGKKQVATYRRYICRILQDFFKTRVVLSSIYHPYADDTYKTIELLGTKENVGVAEYCYYFLENQLELMWNSYRRKTRASGRTSKNSFYLGVVLGFYKKLEEQNSVDEPEAGTTSYGELIRLEEKRLDSFVQMNYPRLRSSGTRRSTVDSRSYQQGLEAGRSMSFNEGLQNSPGGSTPLLK